MWTLYCDFVPHSYETLKWLSSLPILMQESFWRWQRSDRYIISLTLPPIPRTPFSPSLISLVVFVEVKHHVYLQLRLAGQLGPVTLRVFRSRGPRQLPVRREQWAGRCLCRLSEVRAEVEQPGIQTAIFIASLCYERRCFASVADNNARVTCDQPVYSCFVSWLRNDDSQNGFPLL